MDKNEEIQVFGGENFKPKAEEGLEPELTEAEKAEALKVKSETKQETEEEKKKKLEKPKAEVKKVEKPADNKGDKGGGKGKPLNISFENQKPKPNEQKKETTIEETPLSKSSVQKYLKDTIGLDFEDLSELSIKKPLPEVVEKFNKFVEETGRTSVKDFYNLNRDWNKETKDTVITEFLKNKYPNLPDEDIKAQLELISVTEDEEDDLSDRELKKRKLEYSKTYSEALTFMTKLSKEYASPLENKAQPTKELTAEETAKAYQPYWDKRDASLKDFKEIKFSIEGIGDIILPIDKEAKEIVSKYTQTVDSFISQWQNEDGSIDTDSLVQDRIWAHRETRQKLITGIVEQAQALILDSFSKKNRGVNLNKNRQFDERNEEQVGAFQIVGGGNEEESRMGNPLFKQKQN